MSDVAERVDRELAGLCGRGLRWTALWPLASRVIAAAVPFDGAATAAVDPTTLLPTAGVLDGLPAGFCAGLLENEIWADDYDKVAALARGPRHVGVLGVSTGGRPERSARYRELLAPIGLAREARAACVAAGGCWAWLDLYRRVTEEGRRGRDVRGVRRGLAHVRRSVVQDRQEVLHRDEP